MEHFIAPGLAWLINTCHHASEWGLTPEVTKKMGYHRELEAAVETMKALRKRGVRILPGGDYGFAWTPHGTNAKDLEYFVKYVGMSTMEALLSATAWGGPMMRMGKEHRLHAARATSPTSCWSTATRSPTSPCCRTRRASCGDEGRRVPPRAAAARRARDALTRWAA